MLKLTRVRHSILYRKGDIFLIKSGISFCTRQRVNPPQFKSKSRFNLY